MASKILIGTLKHLRLAPCPRDGMTTENAGYSETMQLQGGGAVGVRSAEYHKVFNISFVGPSKDLDGVGFYNRLATGFHGKGLIYFNNPYDYETNLLAAGWASPGLGADGWARIADPTSSTVTYPTTAANTVNQPELSATYAFTGAAATAPAAQRFRHVVVIPADKTLHLGWSGSVSGSGALYARGVLVGDGLAYGPLVALTPLAVTGSARLNATFAGGTFKAVELFVGRTAATTASVTIASVIGQLWTTGFTPLLIGSHVEGSGHTGCMFGDAAITETYLYMHPPRKGMSTKLIEVGAWQR